jgi:diguanylate cyclase (GGDEF)-like protein
MRPNLARGNEASIRVNGNFVQPDGNRVRELRNERGWTQEELAERAGYVKKTIENIEAGRRVLPRTLAEVAEALGVQPGAITGPILERAGGPGSAEGRGGENHAAPATGGQDVPEAGGAAWTWPSGPHFLRPPVQARPAFLAGEMPQVSPGVNASKCSLLVVDDEPYILELLERMLSAEFEVLTAGSADAAEAIFVRRSVDLLLTDQRMPGRTGVSLLDWVQRHHPRTVRLLMTGHEELDDAVDAINRGHVYHYVSKPFHPPERLLQALRNAAEKFELERDRDHLVEELRRSNRELEEANHRLQLRTHELEREAQIDALTGLYNRRAIEEQARFELKRHGRYHGPLSIGLIEVDQFDRLHSEPLRSGSDEILEQLACLLAALLREVDSVGRLYGATFLIVARETGEEGVARLAERLRAAVASTCFTCNGQNLAITLSLGFAVADHVRTDFDAISEVSSAALAEARQAGGNCCAIRGLAAAPAEEA